MSGIEQLLIVARRYAELKDVPLSTVSSRVFDDGKKLAALESGADINVKRLERALGWFAENLSDEEWPSEISRPSLLEVRA
jgi:hypothetical protein